MINVYHRCLKMVYGGMLSEIDKSHYEAWANKELSYALGCVMDGKLDFASGILRMLGRYNESLDINILGEIAEIKVVASEYHVKAGLFYALEFAMDGNVDAMNDLLGLTGIYAERANLDVLKDISLIKSIGCGNN